MSSKSGGFTAEQRRSLASGRFVGRAEDVQHLICVPVASGSMDVASFLASGKPST